MYHVNGNSNNIGNDHSSKSADFRSPSWENNIHERSQGVNLRQKAVNQNDLTKLKVSYSYTRTYRLTEITVGEVMKMVSDAGGNYNAVNRHALIKQLGDDPLENSCDWDWIDQQPLTTILYMITLKGEAIVKPEA
jgi:hypothetical protein